MLDEFFSKSRLEHEPTVSFRVEHRTGASGSQSHDVRTLIMDYEFGSAPRAKSAAVRLATRLGESMDARSSFTLLMLAAYADGGTGRLVAWAFPKEKPFHFRVRGSKAKITVLQNAFSRTSSFRKAALYEGRNRQVDFWKGRVIDKQAMSGFGTAADYWISDFLDSEYSMTGQIGTRLLAKSLRLTYDELSDPHEKDQVSGAIVAIHSSQRPRWSMARFANEYLSGNAKAVFLGKVPPDTRNTTFSFVAREFDDKLNFRVFKLRDNVMISAPFGAIGASVQIIESPNQRKVKCEGIVVDDKIRAKKNVG